MNSKKKENIRLILSIISSTLVITWITIQYIDRKKNLNINN